MKKSLLIILPIAALALVGCRRGGRGGSSNSGQSQTTSSSTQKPTTGPSISGDTSATHPASPYPAVPEGDGSAANPWNVTQAWNYVDTQLTMTYETSASEQDKVKSKQEYYVRGYVCYIQAHSDGRDQAHPHSVQFHMADKNHHVTEDEVMTKSEFVRQGFCVYFADYITPFASQDEAAAIDQKLVTVKGYLLNWAYEPEVTSGGTITEIVK